MRGWTSCGQESGQHKVEYLYSLNIENKFIKIGLNEIFVENCQILIIQWKIVENWQISIIQWNICWEFNKIF